MSVRNFVSAGARITVAMVLLASFVLKVSYAQPTPVRGRVGIGAFEDLLVRHEVVPADLVAIVARAVLVAEFGLALWLLSHWRPRVSAALALVLMVVFSAYTIAVYVRNGDPTCGCFGVLSVEGLRLHLFQNTGIGAVCCLGLLGPGRRCEDAEEPMASDLS